MKWKDLRNSRILHSKLFTDTIWGIAANIFQVAFVSLFFLILARKYPTDIFAQFLVASTIYQMLVAFSSMGLGQWFIREYNIITDRDFLTYRFLKIQTGLGLFFYLINICLSFVLYAEEQVILLCVILGANIIFDNVIYAIKSLNIAEQDQKKTFLILIFDGFLRMCLGCILYFNTFSIITVAVMLICIRFFTVNFFIKKGSSNRINLLSVIRSKISWNDLNKQIISNWQFIIIGSISVVYWRISNVIIAKNLSMQDVAEYEISFRIFSISMIFPIVASGTVFSQFAKHFSFGNKDGAINFYSKIAWIFIAFGVVSFAFVYSFSDYFLPKLFGNQYKGATECIKQMFLTMILFPSVILQANLIVAMKYERVDMWLNLISLIIHIVFSVIGLYYVKSLYVINYSIFLSFLSFHFFQNLFLVYKRIVKWFEVFIFYSFLSAFVLIYKYFSQHYNTYCLFFTFLLLSAAIFIYYFFVTHKDNLQSN